MIFKTLDQITRVSGENVYQIIAFVRGEPEEERTFYVTATTADGARLQIYDAKPALVICHTAYYNDVMRYVAGS